MSYFRHIDFNDIHFDRYRFIIFAMFSPKHERRQVFSATVASCLRVKIRTNPHGSILSAHIKNLVENTLRLAHQAVVSTLLPLNLRVTLLLGHTLSVSFSLCVIGQTSPTRVFTVRSYVCTFAESKSCV